MKKRLLCLAFSLVILYPFFIARAEDSLTPKMIFPENKYDAGEMDEGSVIEHSFKVINQGNGILEVKKVKPG